METWLISDFFSYVEKLWLMFWYSRSSEVNLRFVLTAFAESCESIVIWQHLDSWLLAECWSTAAFARRYPSACRWPLSRVWFVAGTGRLFLRLLLHRLWLVLVFLIELMPSCKMSEHRITRRECFLHILHSDGWAVQYNFLMPRDFSNFSSCDVWLQLRVARGYRIIAGTAAEVAVMAAAPVPAAARVPLFDHHAHRCSWSCLRGCRCRLRARQLAPPRQHIGLAFLHLHQPWERTEACMGVRLLGRAMLGQLVVAAINYDFVRMVKSYDLARYAK